MTVVITRLRDGKGRPPNKNADLAALGLFGLVFPSARFALCWLLGGWVGCLVEYNYCYSFPYNGVCAWVDGLRHLRALPDGHGFDVSLRPFFSWSTMNARMARGLGRG